MKRLLFILLATPIFIRVFAQTQPGQPTSGYGGSVYTHDSVIKINHDDGQSGFWLFLPATPKPDSATVVVFNHGYSEWNPAVNGAWIKHLVRRGNIVIYTRYQSNIATSPTTFTDSAAFAIHRALDTLVAHHDYPQPILSQFFIAGRSFGGVVTANLGHNYAQYGLPKPLGLFMAVPGTSLLTVGKLPTYRYMDSTIRILTIVEKDDAIVDSAFSLEIFDSTVLVPYSHKNLIIHYADNHGTPAINAAHGEDNCPDTTFDSGDHGGVIAGALQDDVTDATDYYCYWKLLDALIDCGVNGNGCLTAFGNTYAQRYMGTWSDGTPIIPLEVRPAIQDTTTGLEPLPSIASKIQVYPNPSNGLVQITSNLPINSYSLYTPDGRCAMKQEHLQAQQTTLQTDKLPIGVCFIRIEVNGQTIIKRLAVIK